MVRQGISGQTRIDHMRKIDFSKESTMSLLLSQEIQVQEGKETLGLLQILGVGIHEKARLEIGMPF